jgi:hypothetical protein
MYIVEPHVMIIYPFNRYSTALVNSSAVLVNAYFPVIELRDIACILLKTGKTVDTVAVKLSILNETNTTAMLTVKLCGIAIDESVVTGKAIVNNTRVVYNGTLYINETAVPVNYYDKLYTVHIYVTDNCEQLLVKENFTEAVLTFNISTTRLTYPVACLDIFVETEARRQNITLLLSIK